MATQKRGGSALMKAIYDRLEADAFTTKYPVYNFTPRSATFPYISFGSPIAVKSAMLSTRDTNAEDITVTIHVWSDKPGDKEAGDILHLIVDALLGTNLEIMEYFAPVFAEL